MYYIDEKTRKIAVPVLAGISSFLIMCILFAIRGFYPFGTDSAMMTDMYSQYIPLLYRFYDVVKGGKNLFYEFSISGGVNLFSETFNEVMNPFNYLLLFFQREHLYLGINVLLLIYPSFAAISAAIFLQYMRPNTRFENIIFAICYGLSGFAIYDYAILKWMIYPIIFPLFFMAFIELGKKRNGFFFSILLAYQIILGVQNGFMTLLFCLFAGAIWFYTIENYQTRLVYACRLGVYTFLGIFLSGICLFPSIYSILTCSRAGVGTTVLSIISRHGLDDLFERLFIVSHPVIIGYLFVFGLQFFVLYRKKRLYVENEQKFLLILNATMLLTVLLEPTNLLWHLGFYVCFPVRYGYMVTLCLALLAQNLLPETEQLKARFSSSSENIHMQTGMSQSSKSIRFIFHIVHSTVCLLCIIVAFYLVGKNQTALVQAFVSLAIFRSCKKQAVLVLCILFLLFWATICMVYTHEIVKRVSISLVLFATCICGFLMITYPQGNEVRTQDNYEYASNNVLHYNERLLKNPKETTLFSGEGSHQTGYLTTTSKAYKELLNDLGYYTYWITTTNYGGTALSDYFLNRVTLSDALNPDELLNEKPLENQKILARQLCEALELDFSDELFQTPKTAFSEEYGTVEIAITEPGILYLDANLPSGDMILWVNDEQVEIEPNHVLANPHELHEIGNYQEACVVRIKVDSQYGYTLPAENLQFGFLQEKSYTKLLEKLQKSEQKLTSQVNQDNASLKVYCSLTQEKDQYVIVPLSTKGWKAKVLSNGKYHKVKTETVYGSLVAVPLKAGEQEIYLYYKTPYLPAGIISSLIALILLILVTLYHRKEEQQPMSVPCVIAQPNPFLQKFEKISEIAFIIVFFVGFIGLYILPTIGLIICSILKMLGVL